jgi:hypothetical protein
MAARYGNPLLPASEPRLFKPLGELQVEAVDAIESHVLWLVRPAGRSLLAAHPNAYAVHALAERIVAGAREQALAQLAYIVACGGLGCDPARLPTVGID